MYKVTIILPVNYNDGEEIPQAEFARCLDMIESVAGGYTDDGLCHGSYRMDNGEICRELCHKVWAVVEDANKVYDLRQYTKTMASLLRQESIYFEVQEVDVSFVRSE